MLKGSRYWPILSLSICERFILENIQLDWGGSLNLHTGGVNRPVWTWRLMGTHLLPFATEIVGFSRIKRPQIEIAIDAVVKSEGLRPAESLRLRQLASLTLR